MEPEKTVENQTRAHHEVLTLPHFDEEATLLSARPVVPLHEIKVEGRSKRRLVVALAVVVALLIGAFARTVTQPDQKATPHETMISASDDAPQSPFPDDAGGSTFSSEESAGSMPVNDDALISGQANNAGASELSKQQASRASKSGGWSAKPNEADQRPNATNDQYDKEIRRAELREARRLRRQADRENRRRRPQGSDDLWRIQEIFEGAPRP